jgi:hypothetical protein
MSTASPSRTGIVLVFSRPSDFELEEEWSAWYDGTHVPTTQAASGAAVATRWEHVDRPQGASPPVGFTHVTIYEFADVLAGAPALLDLLDAPGGARHPADMVVSVEVLLPAGTRWHRRSGPDAGLTGQVIAFVGPNDRAREDEWNTWLDEVHVPDMVGSGAFVNATRWVRAVGPWTASAWRTHERTACRRSRPRRRRQ